MSTIECIVEEEVALVETDLTTKIVSDVEEELFKLDISQGLGFSVKEHIIEFSEYDLTGQNFPQLLLDLVEIFKNKGYIVTSCTTIGDIGVENTQTLCVSEPVVPKSILEKL